MARPQRRRRICCEPEYRIFAPEGCKTDKRVELSCDEFEVIRLVDFKKLTHSQCSKVMGISRTTVTEIYESARFKISDCILNGKKLVIEGGNYRICEGDNPDCINPDCKKKNVNNPIG